GTGAGVKRRRAKKLQGHWSWRQAPLCQKRQAHGSRRQAPPCQKAARALELASSAAVPKGCKGTGAGGNNCQPE
ncbi:MAG: hypothetical protein DRP62_08665, partial [Planctomycetota bacterium]